MGISQKGKRCSNRDQDADHIAYRLLRPSRKLRRSLASGAPAGRYSAWEALMRSHHDMGGLPAGPVERREHDYALWEKRVDALMVLLSAPQRPLLRVDELRRHIQALAPDAYERMSYFERSISGIAHTLLQRGV